MSRTVALAGAMLLVFACALPLGAGSADEEIRKRQAELELLRQQIRQQEERIRERQRQEIATLELLDSYDQGMTLVRKLVGRLKREEAALQAHILTSRKEVKSLEDQLAFLKAHYARYVTSVYTSGNLRDVELLVTARSMGQVYRRSEYLKRFSEQRREDARRISAKRQQLEARQARLQLQLSEERRLLAEKSEEEEQYAALTSERRDILFQIRRDRKTFQKELDRKMQAAREVEGLITSLIERERLRREQEKREAEETGKVPVVPPPSGAFESRRGSLRWPVAEGAIVARFGNQTHPTLKTVTTNTGVDIAVQPGSPVLAVSDGEVSLITWLPSYGNMVIVNHYDGYRTVSTHLSDILVLEGQKIREGEIIGESGEALDGPRLHFEIWKDREKQNPEQWLVPR